jgi:hypothetical protein
VTVQLLLYGVLDDAVSGAGSVAMVRLMGEMETAGVLWCSCVT